MFSRGCRMPLSVEIPAPGEDDDRLLHADELGEALVHGLRLGATEVVTRDFRSGRDHAETY
jgi:hypothetical protein